MTCKTVSETPPPVYCGVLEHAPRGDAAATKKAVDIWRRVETPVRALTGRETALVVLSPAARIGDGADAKPIPPAAYICPGAPPTVYVPGSLLQLIDNADPTKYPDDFLAFVIGHELGHRMNDLTPDGCQLAAFQRPGKGAHEEELADARSAFFITGVGFSASKVARADLVSRFLAAEYALGREDSKTRQDALLGALQHFDGYEALYQAALAVSLSGSLDEADRLLSWADDLVQSEGVLLPELRVVRAIAHINAAAEWAPWDELLDLPTESLRCVALHPGHSALGHDYEEEKLGGPAPPPTQNELKRARSRKLLKDALVLLDDAEARGATPFTVATARTCAEIYLADAPAAAAAQARAESLAPVRADAEVRKALSSNASLVSLVGFARKTPAPPRTQSIERRAWADTLAAALAPLSVAVMTFLAQVRDPSNPYSSDDTDPAPSCARANVEWLLLWSWIRPFSVLPDGAPYGSCPAGYTIAQLLPATAGAKHGLSVCKSHDLSGDLVSVQMPKQTAALEVPAVEMTMRSSPVPPALRELDAWKCGCWWIKRVGVSDGGEVAYDASCSKLGLEGRTVIIATNRHVQRVIQYDFGF